MQNAEVFKLDRQRGMTPVYEVLWRAALTVEVPSALDETARAVLVRDAKEKVGMKFTVARYEECWNAVFEDRSVDTEGVTKDKSDPPRPEDD